MRRVVIIVGVMLLVAGAYQADDLQDLSKAELRQLVADLRDGLAQSRERIDELETALSDRERITQSPTLQLDPAIAEAVVDMQVFTQRRIEGEISSKEMEARAARRGRIDARQTSPVIYDRVNRRYTFRNGRIRGEHIKGVRNWITKLKMDLKYARAGSLVDIPELAVISQTGQIGTLPGMEILQVVDTENVLVSIIRYEQLGGRSRVVGPIAPAQLHRIIQSRLNNPQTKTKVLGKALWLSGIDTNGLADGEPLGLTTTFIVSGTKTYNTAIGGSNTTFVLKPIDLQPYLDRTEIVPASNPQQ